MKKKIFLFAVIILMVFGVKNETLAQGKAFYVEVLGNGLLFSANYDMRFSSANDGLGGRIGVGYIGGNGASVVTVPVMLNYLLGKNGKYFEVGGGVTYASASLDFALSSDESAFLGTLSFMYRKQPENGGFMWRAGFTPVLVEGVFVPYWGGIGLGYSW